MAALPRGARIFLIVLAAAVAVAAAGIVLFVATFDPNRYKPQLIEAVRRATGRDLALNGPLTIKPSLWPTLEAHDVSFANMKGGSRPEMVTLGDAEAQLALIPLLSRIVEIEHLVLRKPDILLETDAAGHPNWRFGPQVPTQTLPKTTEPNASKAPPPVITIRDVLIEDGNVTWRDGRTGHMTAVKLARLDLHSAGADAPVGFKLNAAVDGIPVTANGDTGPLSALQVASPQTTSPWPVHATVTAADARFNLAGGVTHPAEARGYAGTVDGTIPSLAALTPLFPKAGLPPLRNVTFTARVADSGGTIPDLSGFTLHLGDSDAGPWVPGLHLSTLDATAEHMTEPVSLTARGTFQDQPLAVTARLGAPAALLGIPAPPGANPAGPYPVEVNVEAAGATLAAKGGIADPRHLTGAAITLSAHVPDLSELSPLTGRALPAFSNVSFDGRVTEPEGGLAQGIVLKGMRLNTSQGDLSGDVTVGFGARPVVQATLAARQLDVEAVRAAFAAAPPAAPARQPAAPSPPAPPGAPALARPPRGGTVISDRDLDLSVLRTADADIRLRADAVKDADVTYRDVSGHVVLKNGALTADKLTATLPGGHATGSLAIDASQPNPPASVVLHGLSLPLKPLLTAAGLPDDAAGNLEVDADMHGAGRSLHQMASVATGSLGLAMVGGRVENRLFGPALTEIGSAAGIRELASPNGSTEVRCFAARMDAHDGTGTLRALYLDTPLVSIEGDGTLAFGPETMALHVRPLARLGHTGIAVPLDVNGPFRAPRVAVDAKGAAGEAARIAAASGGKNVSPFAGIIIGALNGQGAIKGGQGENCAGSLALARGGSAGPMPSTPSAAVSPQTPASQAPASQTPGPPAAQPKPKPPNAADLLRQFLR